MNSKIIILLFCLGKSALLIAACGPQDFCMGDYSESQEELAVENSQEPDTHKVIKLPDQIQVEPTKITRTQEVQKETLLINHYLERHIWPSADGQPPVYLDKYFVKKRLL